MATTSNIERELGSMETRMDHMESNIAEIRKDMKEVKEMVTKFKGGFVTLMFIGSLVGSVGFAWVVKIFALFPK